MLPLEIQPASSQGGSSEDASSSKNAPSIPELIEVLRYRPQASIHSVLPDIIHLTKERNEHRLKEFISSGAIPVLLKILSDDVTFDLETRIRIAAAMCNIARGSIAQRSFSSCYAVPTLVDSVIGKHQALTGAGAILLKSMLKSEHLVKSMVENEAPLFLLRALMLCTNVEICDTVVDALIQMTTIEPLKDFMIQHKTVEICIYMLHVLARCHYFSISRASDGFYDEDGSQPSFTYKSMRDVLIWYLTQPDEGASSDQKSESNAEMTSPEVMFFPRRMSHDGWEDRLKNESFLGHDESEVPFSNVDNARASLTLELLACLLNDSSSGCSRVTVMQFSLDILRYWMHSGNPLMKQSTLLCTCFLLRKGHRAFVTLRDIISVIYGILVDPDDHNGVKMVQYKGIAVEAVNDLCIFGGDNVRLAIDAAGILAPMLRLLEMAEFQLQHLTLRAMNSVCAHFYPLRTLVSIGGIPYLCEFLSNGLKEIQGDKTSVRRSRPLVRAALGCLSRKRLATISIAEPELITSQKQEEDYSRFRRLDYCAALLRSISAIQSTEWLHVLNKCRIIPLALDALVQNHSTVIRKQALGILTSLVTMKDSNAIVNIGLEDGCDLLLNLRTHAEKIEDPESVYWIAWINLILYHVSQHPKILKILQTSVKVHYTEQVEISRNSLSRMFKPNQAHLDLEWLSSCI